MLLSIFYALVAFINSFVPQPTLVEGLIGQPKSLNVLDITTNQPDRDIAKFIHRGLMKYDAVGNLIPDLAESYAISQDKKDYTFKLRKGLTWQNGKKFVSDDVIYTVSKLNLDAVAVDKLDDYSVRFRLARDPYAPFLDVMTQYLLPSNYRNEEKPGINQIGIGDYRIARVTKSDKIDSVILTLTWPWAKTKYKFPRIIFKFYSDAKQLETAARLGEVDSFGSSNNFVSLNNYNVISAPVGARVYSLYLNISKNSLKDAALRQYLGYLSPKTEIVEKILNGSGVVSNNPLENTFVNPTATPSYAKKTDYKLKEGYSDEIQLTIPKTSTVERHIYLSIADLLKKAWEEAGMKINIREIPLDKIFPEVIAKKDFEILLFGQEFSRDPDVYSLWHSNQKDLPGLNFTSFSSVLADKSLEDARKEFDKDLRIKYYLNFIRVFNTDVPAISLYHPLYNYYFRKNITGPDLRGFFFTFDRFNNFEDWKKN